jgi:hypothetical protein
MRRSAVHAHTLALSLRLGTGYDWGLAALILLAGPAVFSAIDFPAPADMFLFRLSALPLLLFPVVYLAAAHDPAGRAWAVRASILLRALGGGFLGGLALAHRPAGFNMYMAAAFLDIAWAAVHALLWSRVRRHR